MGKEKPQYEDCPTKEIRIEVLYNDENQCLSFAGTSVPAGYDHQHFQTQINELKELDNRVHHHKPFVF